MFSMKIIIVLSLLFSTLFSNDNLQKISLQLQWKHQFQFAGYYMAKEKGFYKDAGFDVELKEFQYGMNVADEVTTHRADFGTGRPTLIINRSEGDRVVLLASIFQSSPNVLIATKESNITKVEDFKGKRIMVTGDAKEDATIMTMIFSHGLNRRDLITQEHTFNIDDLINKKTDLISSYISNEPFLLEEKGVQSVIFDPKEYGFDFYNDILFTTQEYLEDNYEAAQKFTQASLRGWEYAFDNIEQSVDLILKKYNTQNKSKEALIYEAEELKKLAYYKTDKLGHIDKNKVERIYDYYRIMGFTKSKINFNSFVQTVSQQSFYLTLNEQDYLEKKKKITMCIDPNWMPFESFDKNNNYIGMSADYFKLFKERLNIEFKVHKTVTWEESLAAAKNRKCDILSLAMETPTRKEYLNFTTPYLKLPLVVATKMDRQFIDSVKDLKDKKLGIPKGYAFVELLKNKYPKLQIVEVDNIDDGLEQVKENKLYGYIGTLASIGYKFQEQYSGELKIAGKLNESWDLGIGVRNDDSILLGILQKAVNSISVEQNRDILNRWISIKYEENIDYTLVWKVLASSFVIIMIILYFYFKEQGLKNALQKQKDEFETIFRNSKDGIALLDLESNFLNFNNEYLRMTGFTREELLQKSCIELTDEDDLEKTKHVIDILNKEGYIQNFEKTCIVKDGKKLFVNMSLSLMPDKQRILISTKDMTQIKQLESHKKLASMGEMIGNIAHQWRQPLSVISTLATGISMKKEIGVLQDEEFFNACASIDETSQYLSRTIDDFTNYISGKKQLVNFNLKNDTDSFIKLVDSTIKTHYINVILELEEHIQIKGYPNELVQCFINIFNNAKDAMVINDIKIEDRYMIITQYVKNNKVYIEFQDSAGGIPQEVMEKIFEPYFTTKHDFQGTGLGLHMTYNIIVNSMGGKIEVENTVFQCNKKEYKGALFRIILPLNN